VPERERTVVVLQPGYFPWLGFFHQMLLADLFVLQDDAQFTRNSWRHRMKIRNETGWEWLTIPVLTRGRHPQRIADVQIDETKPWRDRHLHVLEARYARTPHWSTYRPELEELIRSSSSSLVHVARTSIDFLRRHLAIETPLRYSSELGLEDRFAVPGRGRRARSEKLSRFVRSLGGSVFLEGASGRDLLDLPTFERAGVRVVFHSLEHPQYPQAHPGFEPFMSSLDLLLNVGPNAGSLVGRT